MKLGPTGVGFVYGRIVAVNHFGWCQSHVKSLLLQDHHIADYVRLVTS